ncbi:MAG: DUF481 domain-containing protein, partial [Victivallales bacterium]|nr:DUF481 domain-containing protein [Victivallales bacterium]
IRDIKFVWGEGMEDPTIPPPPAGRDWSGEFTLDISGKSGNTDKFNAGAGASATLAGPDDKLRLYVTGKYERESGITSTEEYIGGIDFERNIADTRSAWYARYEIEQEETSGLSLRHEVGLGYGYYFLKDDITTLRGRVGFTGATKEYTDGSHDDALGIEMALHFERKIDEWGKLVSDLTYQPTFEDLGNFRLIHESALDIPVLVSVPLNLRIGMKNEYNSQVAEGTEHMETSYFAKIVYKWN